MDTSALLAYLTDGVDDATKAQITAVFANSIVASKAASLRDQKDLDTLNAKLTQHQNDLDALDAAGNPVGYRAWYNKNWPEIQKLVSERDELKKKVGEIPNPSPAPANGKQYTDEEISRLIDTRFREQIAPNVANVLKSTGRLVQKHIRAGRSSDIDFDALDKIMGDAQKSGRSMTVDDAYAEWDRPEREKSDAAARETEIQKRVDAELAKRGTSANFPAGADATPGVLAARSTDKFDRSALNQDLLSAWNGAASRQ
jgi:hypothetical protein